MEELWIFVADTQASLGRLQAKAGNESESRFMFIKFKFINGGYSSFYTALLFFVLKKIWACR